MFSQLLTFLGIRSQDLSKCFSSRLQRKHNPFQSGGPLGPSHPPLGPNSFGSLSSPHLQSSSFLEASQQCSHSI